MMTYVNLVEDLVASQREILGDGAVSIAQRVSGIQVSDDGTVQGIDSDGVEVVDDLVSEYVDNLGDAATVTLRSVANEYDNELELPSSL